MKDNEIGEIKENSSLKKWDDSGVDILDRFGLTRFCFWYNRVATFRSL